MNEWTQWGQWVTWVPWDHVSHSRDSAKQWGGGVLPLAVDALHASPAGSNQSDYSIGSVVHCLNQTSDSILKNTKVRSSLELASQPASSVHFSARQWGNFPDWTLLTVRGEGHSWHGVHAGLSNVLEVHWDVPGKGRESRGVTYRRAYREREELCKKAGLFAVGKFWGQEEEIKHMVTTASFLRVKTTQRCVFTSFNFDPHGSFRPLIPVCSAAQDLMELLPSKGGCLLETQLLC